MKYKVETKTDELQIFNNEADFRMYLIKNHLGDLDIERHYQGDVCIVTIPKWKAERNKYIQAKIKDCERWGCE